MLGSDKALWFPIRFALIPLGLSTVHCSHGISSLLHKKRKTANVLSLVTSPRYPPSQLMPFCHMRACPCVCPNMVISLNVEASQTNLAQTLKKQAASPGCRPSNNYCVFSPLCSPFFLSLCASGLHLLLLFHSHLIYFSAFSWVVFTTRRHYNL